MSILLLKRDQEEPVAVFGSHLEKLATYAVAAGETLGTLYVSITPAAPPGWTRLFAGSTARPLDIQRPALEPSSSYGLPVAGSP